MSVSGTLFEDTAAGRTGGAICCWSDRRPAGDLAVVSSTFRRSTSGERGGAVFGSGARAAFSGCVFELTHSGLQGGAVFGAQEVTVSSNVFNATSSDIDGGAVFGTVANLYDATFLGTTATQVRARARPFAIGIARRVWPCLALRL